MRNVFGWSLAGLICTSAVAWGQARVEPPRVRPAPAAVAAPAAQGAATAAQGTAHQQIAACLYFGAHNEVELAKLAQQKAKSDSVKDFAAQMIKEHSREADKLAKIAGNLVNATDARTGGVEVRREVRKVPAQETREEAREDRVEGRERARETGDREERREGREAAREDRRNDREVRTATTTIAPSGGFNWVAIHREMGEQCLQSAKKELSSKEGNEFDQCYIGMQLGAHMHMVDALKVFQNHATGELQQDLEQSEKQAEQHLKEAKKIMDEIKDKPTNNKSDK